MYMYVYIYIDWFLEVENKQISDDLLVNDWNCLTNLWRWFLGTDFLTQTWLTLQDIAIHSEKNMPLSFAA